jgi:hypothetical protein
MKENLEGDKGIKGTEEWKDRGRGIMIGLRTP